jgi:CelD/BcsL family acetyltransferase involved in cellulose biosynthesis
MQNRSFKTLSELAKAFPVFLDLEASGWKGIKGTGSAIKCNENLIKFYNFLLTRFSEYGESIIDILYIDERPISGQLGFIINDTYYLVKVGYDEAMSHISPGNLHRELLLKTYAPKQQIKYFNLVSGEYTLWHKQWNASSHDTYEVVIFNRTIKALLAFSYIQTKEFIKPFYRSFIKPMLIKIRFLTAKI